MYHFILLSDLKEKSDYKEHLKSEAWEYHICFQGSNALIVEELLRTGINEAQSVIKLNMTMLKASYAQTHLWDDFHPVCF